MRRYLSIGSSVFFSSIVLPYLCILFINGPSACLEIKEPDLQGCLMWILELELPEGSEVEAEKAQAVIVRTNFYQALQEGKKASEIAWETWEQARDRGIYALDPDRCGILENCLQETGEVALIWNNKLCPVPYHYCSAGKTRNGAEVFHDQSYEYLKSVESEEDLSCKDYLSSVYLNAEQFPVDMKITGRDSAGYVTEISLDGETVSGEEYCQQLGLASGNFSVQKVDKTIRILSKGQGHGLGYSQYGGNQLAKKGENFIQILEWYFPAMSLAEIQPDF